MRMSGLALMLAAAMFVVAELLAFSIFIAQGEAYDLRRFATTDAFLLQSVLALFAGILSLGGLVGLYLRQFETAGRLGLIGFLLAFVGTVLVVGDFYTTTFVTPLVALEAPAFLDDPLAGVLQVWLPFSFGVLGLSWLLFSVATVRARVYPRLVSWLLLIGAVASLVPLPLFNLLFDAALGWLGFGLFRMMGISRHRSKPRR